MPQARRSLQLAEGGQAIWAVDVQDVEDDPGGQADIGLGPASPPAADAVGVGGGVLDAVADQRVLGRPITSWAAGTRAGQAGPARGGAGPVDGVDGDAAGGVAEGGSYVAIDRRYDAIPRYRTSFIGFLPQGAPTSGALANCVAYRLDERLAGLAASQQMIYTRYADDITFSSSAPFERAAAVGLIRAVDQIAQGSGFLLHRKKIRIVPPGARKLVLGLLVDRDAPRLTKETRGRIANHVRGVQQFGLREHTRHRGFSSLRGLVRYVDGLLAFAHDIEPEWAQPLQQQWEESLASHGWRIDLTEL